LKYFFRQLSYYVYIYLYVCIYIDINSVNSACIKYVFIINNSKNILTDDIYKLRKLTKNLFKIIQQYYAE